MKHTPPKLPPMPLSPKHQRSVEKSKAINQKVESFVNSNFKNSPVSSEDKMAASSGSLANTKAFFESEIKLVMKMVEQSNKLYKQKENENSELQKKVKEYESKIHQLELAAIEYTACKARDQTFKMEEKDERKTRKKPINEQPGLSKELNRTTSEFTLDRAYDRLEKEWKIKYEMLDKRLREQNAKLRQKADNLAEQLKKQKQINFQITQQNKKSATAAAKATFDHNKIQKEYQNLASQHKLLEQRYHELQDKHGQTVAEYQIKLTNLKSIITGINQKFWPQKQSPKKAEGYYSINKPLNRNQSQQSIESFSSSKYIAPSHAEINLKEQNEYLRTQLIRALDQKGALQMKVNKYKKMAIKYESIAKATKEDQKQFSVSSNQNSNFMANYEKAKEIQKSEKTFKKKRQTSVLLIQGTQKKQKEILQQKKINNLLTQISFLVQPAKKIDFGNKKIQNQQQIEFLEHVLQKLKVNFEQIMKLRKKIQKLNDEKQALEKEKRSLEKKSKEDASSLKNYLKKSCINLATPKSEDSTDKAFKHINLMEIEHDEDGEQNGNHYEQFSKSMLSHYSQSVAFQQNEVRLLKEKIVTLEQTIKNLEEFKVKNSAIIKSNEYVKENRIVPYSPGNSQRIDIEFTSSECCPFDMFKQKLGEFYQNTMKELDDWQEKALKSLNNMNSSKKLAEIQQEQNENSSQQLIPIIVQKNIMKMSQEFQSIKNSSFDRQNVVKNQEYASVLFGSQKLSKSFIKDQSEAPAETFQDIINKKLEDFNQFSSNWIQKLSTKNIDKKESCHQNIKIEDLKPKQIQESNQIPKLTFKNGPMTDRSAVENQSHFKFEFEQIDAVSEQLPDEQIRAQRIILIRQELSYQVQKSDIFRFRDMQKSSLSKKSQKSCEL